MSEYPRPQMRRESYLCLNGTWTYLIKGKDRTLSGNALVPFSLESELGGGIDPLKKNELLIMEREFVLPDLFNQGRVLLHLDGCDASCDVFVNGQSVGTGDCGYLPVICDITKALEDVNHLKIIIRDPTEAGGQPRGKQSSSPKGIWYTAQSGLWQTVWLESVPEHYIESIKLTPHYDEHQVEILVRTNHSGTALVECDGQTIECSVGLPSFLVLDHVHPWSVEDPYLYDLKIHFEQDSIESYFGMRKFSIEEDEQGIKRLFLNNKPYFHTGVLDQGYMSDTLMSWPCDQAMIDDIMTAKSMGFNMLRKHIKVEPLRWYYHCDRLGMLVWQDMVSGGGPYNKFTINLPLFTDIHYKDNIYWLFGRSSLMEREKFIRDLKGMIDHLYNVPSIAMWVIFNEGWGQFDVSKAYELVCSLDKTRTVIPCSGWHDQKIGNIRSWHVYFRPYKFKKDPLGRCVLLSEFGGYQLPVEGHLVNEDPYGYKDIKDSTHLENELKELYEHQIIPAKELGLSASVFTQLTDVEREVNGLMTYDRHVLKINPDVMMKLNRQLY
ncbi:MAG: glycoside hydrolase family 2 [Erysipelotrichaceae bacterium]|nr:glycoside hydrolase family 2 [Erysipelotrichaceae bacterium]